MRGCRKPTNGCLFRSSLRRKRRSRGRRCRLTGSDALAVRASKRLRSDELLVASLGSTILRKHMDEVPLWRGDSVRVKQLVDDFARYLYLPRLAGPEVLAQAIRDGVALLTWRKDTFAFAESYDEAAARYRGLRAGQGVNVSPDSTGLVVKPDVAARQLDAEVKSQKPPAEESMAIKTVRDQRTAPAATSAAGGAVATIPRLGSSSIRPAWSATPGASLMR